MSVKEVFEKYRSYLIGVTGVEMVSTSNNSIVIYVSKLTPEIYKFLPQTLDGVPVRIIETGRVKLLRQ